MTPTSWGVGGHGAANLNASGHVRSRGHIDDLMPERHAGHSRSGDRRRHLGHGGGLAVGAYAGRRDLIPARCMKWWPQIEAGNATFEGK